MTNSELLNLTRDELLNSSDAIKGQWFKAQRQKGGLTQSEYAKFLGISVEQLKRVEAGKRK